MTAEQIGALLSPITIAALTGLLLAVIGGLATGIGVVIKAVGEIRTTAGKIEVRVNSEKTDLEGQLRAEQIKNELLREMLEERKITAGLLAQAAAQALPSMVATAPALIVPPVAAEPVKVEVVNPPDNPVPVTKPIAVKP